MPRNKIGFILLSPARRPLSSTRIAVLNMLPYLRAAAWDAEITFEPETPDEQPDVGGVAEKLLRAGATIAYFQKVQGPGVLREARILARHGVRTVFGVCDYVNNELAEACDVTIVVTDYLKSLYDPALWHKIHVVHDGIEVPDHHKSRWDSTAGDGRMRAVLVNSLSLDRLPVLGAPPGFVDVSVVGNYPLADVPFGHLRETWWKLYGDHNLRAKLAALQWLIGRPFRKIDWGPGTVYDILLAADVGIIPVDPDPTPAPGLPVAAWQVKSENRLTLKMALGLPVVASPVPSYLPIIEQGRNGYIARSKEEWRHCLEELRDPTKREAVGKAARATVLPRFSMEEQARKLIEVLELVVKQDTGRPPEVEEFKAAAEARQIKS